MCINGDYGSYLLTGHEKDEWSIKETSTMLIIQKASKGKTIINIVVIFNHVILFLTVYLLHGFWETKTKSLLLTAMITIYFNYIF